MPKPIVYTDHISKNSKAAECVKQADEVVTILIDELQTVSEVLSDPFKASSHLMRAMRLANQVQTQLYQTGIPSYRQAPLFAVNNSGGLK